MSSARVLATRRSGGCRGPWWSGALPAERGTCRAYAIGLGYLDKAGLGAWDATERLERLDRENLELAVLYPTLGVLWEAECEDLELAQEYTRVYNRWIVEFCAGSGGRLVPIAHLSLGIPAEADREPARAAHDGVKGVFIAPFVMTRK